MTMSEEVTRKERYVTQCYENAASRLVSQVTEGCFQLEGAGADAEAFRRYGASVLILLERVNESIKETLYAYGCVDGEDE